ncbi:MAG TPA: NAD-dependent epimerase/dehydratase family protein [Propionibacteriaceae bacterium]|nr:NAD-dependent epimerase/dehydratase family protein [Propionibacteriaceae bacterium]
MRVFVAGATGVLGRQLIPRLAASGHQVVGMGRAPSGQLVLRSGKPVHDRLAGTVVIQTA